MSKITKENFKERLPQIKQSLQKSKLIAIDLEFSALDPLRNQVSSLFDTNHERYTKLRKNTENVIPLQVGLTAFHFDSNSNNYYGEVFTFYVSPPAFANIDRTFYIQPSSRDFLCLHNFDFNKWAYSGVPYLNRNEETELRRQLQDNDFLGEGSRSYHIFNNATWDYSTIINKWYMKSKEGDYLEIPEINQRYSVCCEVIYLLHKHVRSRFNDVWTFHKDNCFRVERVSSERLQELSKLCTLRTDVINNLLGFTEIFRLLVSMKKPIIGHNLLQDIMIMINNFEEPLPHSYLKFKQLAHDLFPTIFDTKVLFYELRKTISKEKLPDKIDLEGLFCYFKEGIGRHLAVDVSAIDCDVKKEDLDNYHEAGWDSFCAGYIFIRMAYYNLSQHYPKSRSFVTSELIGGLAQYKNWVNVIKGSTSHIRLDAEDPVSSRPPWLIVESAKSEPIDVGLLSSLLDSYGFIDVKRISSKGDRVLVAVDTYRAAREISKVFKTSPQFHVQRYNFIKHSRSGRALLLAAFTISGTLLIWLTHSVMRK